MNHKSFLLAVFIGLLLLTACKTSSPEIEEATSSPESMAMTISMTPAQMDLAGVILGRPEPRVISTHIDCTGRVEVPPQSLASVYAPVPGFVQTVQHLPGDFVRKGTLLTTLRHPDLIKLQSEFLQIKNQLPFLKQEYERKKALAESDAASTKALQEAKTDLDMAQVRFKGLRAELELVGLSVKKLEEEEEIQTSLPIYAPVSGYITKLEVNLGRLVTPSDLLFEIIDQQHMHLELQIFAKDLSQVHEGQRIVCSVPNSAQTYEAKVHLIGKMIDPETKTATIHGHFALEPVPITAGTYLQARVFTDGEKVPAVPNDALVQTGGETYVFVKGPEGFEKRAVQTGRTDGQYTEIHNLALADDELIAIAGAYYINGSEPVE